MVVSRCINDAVRVEYLMPFITVLSNFELLMMIEEFHKNLVKLSEWAVKYKGNVL